MEQELINKICDCDMVYFIVPNYRDNLCTNFYIFNERSLCCFQNKPERLEQYLRVTKQFIVLSGTMADSFATAFMQHTDSEPKMLYLSAQDYSRQSIQGDILETPAAKAYLNKFLALNCCVSS